MEDGDSSSLLGTEGRGPVRAARVVLLEHLPERAVYSIRADNIARARSEDDAAPEDALGPSP